MARKHNGGFISEENYWNIGSPERGRDGDTARLAAKKYNDHRHNAIQIDMADSMIAWIEEKQLASFHPENPNNQGGIIDNEPDTASGIRKPGDLALYQDVLWMFDGSSVVALGNPGVFINNQGDVVRKNFVVEYPFTTYNEFSAPTASNLLNKPKQYVGSVVVDYSDYALNPQHTTSSIEVVAGIRSDALNSAIINISQTNPELALEFLETRDLSMRMTIRVERFQAVDIGNTKRFLTSLEDATEIVLNAYSDNGMILLQADLPFAINSSFMYNMYIVKPSVNDILANTNIPQDIIQQFSLESSLADIINDSVAEIIKASVKIRNRA